MKIAVIAGTNTDTRMGMEYLRKLDPALELTIRKKKNASMIFFTRQEHAASRTFSFIATPWQAPLTLTPT